jgi:hypothetical protein
VGENVLKHLLNQDEDEAKAVLLKLCSPKLRSDSGEDD